MSNTTEVAVREPASSNPISVFQSESSFEAAQRIARALTSSGLVPQAYQGPNGIPNALIAMDMGNRMGLSPMTVMQNLHVIEGKPSWASSFIISALNACGLFSPLRWRITDLGERTVSVDKWVGPKGERRKVTESVTIHDKQWIAYAIEKATGEVLEGPPVSIGMAVAEGWFTKPGSKWVTMEDLMGRYRSAAFFGRLYAPHLLNGMSTADEIIDVEYSVVSEPAAAPATPANAAPQGRAGKLHAALANGKEEPAKPAEKPASGKRGAGKGKTAEAAAEPASEPVEAQEAETVEYEDVTHEEGDPRDQPFEGGNGNADDMFGDDDEFSPE